MARTFDDGLGGRDGLAALGGVAEVLLHVLDEGLEAAHELVHEEGHLGELVLGELQGEVGRVGLRDQSLLVGEARAPRVAAGPHPLPVVLPPLYVLPGPPNK